MENQEKYDRKLPITVKMGFGIANLGDTIITEFVGAFLIFFLINIAAFLIKYIFVHLLVLQYRFWLGKNFPA